MLGTAIDDVDALIADLGAVRRRLAKAHADGVDPDALWEAEATLRHVGERARRRASILRRTIEVVDLRR